MGPLVAAALLFALDRAVDGPLLFGLTGLSAGPAFAATPSANRNAPLLALGDSIAFGYDPRVSDRTSAANFVGYPERAAALAGVEDVNAACPGETSGSYLSSTEPDNGCRLWRSRLPLHVVYRGTQGSFARAYLAKHPDAKTLLFSLGTNDLLLVRKSCHGDGTCVQRVLPDALVKYGQNLERAFSQLEAAGFRGRGITLGAYALDYQNAWETLAVQSMNAILARVAKNHGFVFVDAFQTFEVLSRSEGGNACRAGLLVELSAGVCDAHPSARGREVLAALVANAIRSEAF